ncbi:MAG: hypothetical protein WC683_04060 [bacterium]
METTDYRRLSVSCRAAAYQIAKLSKEMTKLERETILSGIRIDLRNVLAALETEERG